MIGAKWPIRTLLAAWLALAADAAGAAGPVAVLLSGPEPMYAAPLAAFQADLELPTRVFSLEGDLAQAPARMAELLSEKPALILALGAKAAVVAKTWTAERPEIPVVFAMVVDWEKYDLLSGQDNVAGVAHEAAPGTQLAHVALLRPETRRIGVVYSEDHSAEALRRANQEAQRLGLEVVALPLRHPREFQRLFRQLEGSIDAFWLLPDPAVHTLENVAWLEERCVRNRLVCLGPSRNVASSGVLLAVDSDDTSVGAQAAALAKEVLLGGRSPRTLGVQAPVGTRVYLNKRTARRIRLEIPPAAAALASEVVE